MFGLLIFLSASLGLLAKETVGFSGVVLKQIIAGILGFIGMVIASQFQYKKLKKISFFIFLFSFILTALVFMPGIGIELGGAKRWLLIGPISVQPAEFLKLGFIIYFAAWLSSVKQHIHTVEYGFLPMAVIFGSITGLLLAQPNTGILVIILAAGGAMLFISGLRFKYILLITLILIIGLGTLATFRPYIKDRIITFLSLESVDALDEGYQIRQSLIAIGSGGFWGKGFGHGVQKFNYLPEPIGDSIYAVFAEEFGFVGGVTLIIAFLFFALIGLTIAARAPDQFSRLLAVGIVILIVAQSYLSIGAMLGVFPLSGVPVLFVSQGGSALFFTLIEVGILLNISKYTDHK